MNSLVSRDAAILWPQPFITHSVLLEKKESKIKTLFLSFSSSEWQWAVGVKGILSLDNLERDG